jgi:hypothetical protein
MHTNSSFNDHPIELIPHLLGIFGDDLVLNFSRYAYMPRERLDKREKFSVPIAEVTPNWLTYQILSLHPTQELALHSNVELGKKRRHIPMLDFRGMTKGQLSAVMDIFSSDFSEDLQVYFSGRSYHAYFPKLLTRAEWVKFMGSALLCNSPNDASVVDQRWVGHRLIGGYAALRWSCNTTHYRSYPKRIELLELDKAFSERRTSSGLIRGISRTNQYYGELVELAMREIGLKYWREKPIQQAGKIGRLDFVVRRDDGVRVGVEVIYCKEKSLTVSQIAHIKRLLAGIRMEATLSYCILVTNGYFPEASKAALRSEGLRIEFIEHTLNPEDLSTQLRRVLASNSSILDNYTGKIIEDTFGRSK